MFGTFCILFVTAEKIQNRVEETKVVICSGNGLNILASMAVTQGSLT